jgi:hypothetical protein
MRHAAVSAEGAAVSLPFSPPRHAEPVSSIFRCVRKAEAKSGELASPRLSFRLSAWNGNDPYWTDYYETSWGFYQKGVDTFLF